MRCVEVTEVSEPSICFTAEREAGGVFNRVALSEVRQRRGDGMLNSSDRPGTVTSEYHRSSAGI